MNLDLHSVVCLLFCLWTTGLSGCQAEITDKGNVCNGTGCLNRIVGGEPTNIERHPYQVSLEWNKRHDCGGSIINTEWIVTAAHCVHRKAPQSLRVRVGSTYIESGGSIHQAARIIQHPQFKIKIFDFDVALVKVSKPFIYSNKVRPISLSSNEPPVGTVVTITGWGRLLVSGPIPRVLQRVEVNIIDRLECVRRYNKIDLSVTKRMICAGLPRGGKDACSGDSGGPLVANGNLAGIVSWGYGCAHTFYPGVYSNTAEFSRWITKETRSK